MATCDLGLERCELYWAAVSAHVYAHLLGVYLIVVYDYLPKHEGRMLTEHLCSSFFVSIFVHFRRTC